MAYQGKKSKGGNRRATPKSRAPARAPGRRPTWGATPRAAPGRTAYAAAKRIIETYAPAPVCRLIDGTKDEVQQIGHIGAMGQMPDGATKKSNYASARVNAERVNFWSEIRPLGVPASTTLTLSDLGGYRVCNIAQNSTGDPTDMSRTGSTVALRKLRIRGNIHWRSLRTLTFQNESVNTPDAPTGVAANRTVVESGQVRLVLVRDSAMYDPKASCPAREIMVSGSLPAADGFDPPGYAGRYKIVDHKLFAFDADDNSLSVDWNVPLSQRCQFASAEAHSERTSGLYLLVLGTKYSEVMPLVDVNDHDVGTAPVVSLQIETTFTNVV